MNFSEHQDPSESMKVLQIKILGLKAQQRYIVRCVVESVLARVQKDYPYCRVVIEEVKDWETIQRYTPVMIAPALVLNDELVYNQWIPTREQVEKWLRERIETTTAN